MKKGISRLLVSTTAAVIALANTVNVNASIEGSESIGNERYIKIDNEVNSRSAFIQTANKTAYNTEDTEITTEEMQQMESMSLYSVDPSQLTTLSASVSYSPVSVNNHGLANGISFMKYEIDYNKYDSNSVEYIVIHDTGNTRAGADAMAHYYYFATGDRDSSAHYFVDSAQVVQIIDDSEGSWHSGVKYKTYATPVSNHNSIGIEMCINSDGNYQQMVQNTIDLSAYLLYTYDLPIDNLVRHHDANGKCCPMTMSHNGWSDWNEFKSAVRAKLSTYYSHGSGSDTEVQSPILYYNNILGSSCLSAETLQSVLLSNNSSISAETALRTANAYIDIGAVYGIRGDIAFFQAMLETGYLKYGGEVDPTWHNYCGLKNADATGYAYYENVENGVEAHIQHLFCYATNLPIPEGRAKLDPRFFDFLRGSVSTWEELSGRWAVPGFDPGTYNSLEEARQAHRSYGDIIVSLFASAGGVGVMTDGMTSGGNTGSYWEAPIYSGAAAGARPLLAMGQSGSDVKEIQGYFKTIGYNFVEVTGTFDENTLRAVLDFQDRYDLDMDGAVGEDTWKWIINTYVNAVQSGSAIVDGNQVLSLADLKQVAAGEKPSGNTGSLQTEATIGGAGVETKIYKTAAEVAGVSAANRSMVHLGSSGADVTALQKLLNTLGYGLVVDGDFGNGTNSAVINFQSKNGLDADGWVGPLTWSKLGDTKVEVLSVSGGDQSGSSTQTETPKTDPEPSQSTQPTISVTNRSIVSRGSYGEDVKALQQILNMVGYGLDADGDFGSLTHRAVVDFQTKHQLDADGYVGKMTWAELGKVQGSNTTDQTATQQPTEQGSTQGSDAQESTSANSGKTVYFGDSGSDVTALQKLLNQHGASLEVDGAFGSATYNALTAFQNANGLVADGICGPLTWAKL